MNQEIKKSPFTNIKVKTNNTRNNYKVAVIVSDWNKKITEKLLEACLKRLRKSEITNICTSHVPGTFELPIAANHQLLYDNYDAVICLGCVIKGETIHDQIISFTTAATLQKISIEYSVPIIFGVVTTNTEEQAVERAGGTKGNKGEDAALTAIEMIKYKEKYPISFVDEFGDDQI